jgi:HAE1 family hydrophobic/amphiphilic exporter-1
MIKTFISRPIFTLMLMTTLVVFGLFSYPRIGVDQMPEVEFPVVTITTALPGADPETIERNVTQPLEEALSTLAGVDTLRSVNVENVSQIIVRFTLDRNVNVAAQDVRDRVQTTLSKLPREIETPIVEKFDIGASPIMTLAMSGPIPVQEMTRLADDVLKPTLQQIAGVGTIDLLGGRKREITIVVDPVRLRGFGLGATDVTAAVRAQSVDVPGGRTSEPGVERSVKLKAEAQSVDDLRNVVVASPMGTPIRLRDVADVIDGPAEARSIARVGSKSAIGLVVRKQSGANTVQVADALKENLERVSKRLPPGCQVTLAIDGSKFIRQSIHAVQEDLILGAFLAVVIVLFFLRNWRSTLIAAVALPTSIIGTFAVMRALNFTFNIITMLALTLSIGLLIDDAIVVIENIVRHLEHGETPREAARKATSEIALAVLAVTLAVVAVFVPVAFMEGLMGRFFYQFGVTVAVAVIISYAVSMTLTPTLAARLLREAGPPGRLSRAIESLLRAVESTYRRALSAMLRHRAITMVVAVGVLGLTFVMARQLKFTFMPAQDMAMIKVNLELPAGTSLDVTDRSASDLTRQIQSVPGVHDTFVTVGGGAQEEVHKSEIAVNLVPIADRTFSQMEFKQHLRRTLRAPKGSRLSIVDFSPVSGGGNRPQMVQFNLRSTNWKELLAAVEKTREAMLKNPGFVDVDLTYRGGKPQLEVAVDRDRAATLGMTASTLGNTIRALMGGTKFAEYREGGDTFDVKLKLPPEIAADPVALGSIPVRAPNGQLIELQSIATVRAGEGPSQIDRQSQLRQVTILADLQNYSLGEATQFLSAFATQLPPSIETDFEGQGRELANAGKAFLLALLLGIILVYIILAAQFESLIHPLTIMMALPFALIGAIVGLLVAREYMSMFAMIGVILLMGLVTKNGILLVEFTNQLREKGRSTHDALVEAGPIRLRPILMTTIAMIAGMIPVALAKGDGAETRVPMAVAIIGGLVSSTVLTLGVVPVVYSLLDGLRHRILPHKPEAHELMALSDSLEGPASGTISARDAE